MRKRFGRRLLGTLAGASLVCGWILSAGPAAAALPGAVPPVVPGHARLAEAKADAQTRGELLLGELNCLSCHKAEQNARVLPRPAPDLSAIGSRATPQWIRGYVEAPHTMKPGTPMPDVFHASEARSKAGAAEFLTHYLVSLGGPIKPATVQGDKLLVDAGEKLFNTIGCAACHAPQGKDGKPMDMKSPSVPLGGLAAKTTADQLQQFLMDPHAARPSGRMPYLKLTGEEARAIAVYLLRDQLNNPQTKDGPPVAVSGLKYTLWDVAAKDVKAETLDKLKGKPKTGVVAGFAPTVPGVKGSNYTIKFAAALLVPKDGRYTFYVSSDDGTRLYINGKQVIENDGVHPAQEKTGSVELKAGAVPLVLNYFQGGGEAVLKVEWSGPDLKRQAIPPAALSNAEGKPMVPL
ncbi:MAG TPA: PA14 domain-containing protein, partial [Humisphaera sp.]